MFPILGIITLDYLSQSIDEFVFILEDKSYLVLVDSLYWQSIEDFLKHRVDCSLFVFLTTFPLSLDDALNRFLRPSRVSLSALDANLIRRLSFPILPTSNADFMDICFAAIIAWMSAGSDNKDSRS